MMQHAIAPPLYGQDLLVDNIFIRDIFMRDIVNGPFFSIRIMKMRRPDL